MRTTSKQSSKIAWFRCNPLVLRDWRIARVPMRRPCACLLLAFALAVGPAAAGPEGGNIVGGSGSISQSGLTTAIKQNSAALAIDWNSYNVGRNEIVNYIQPGAASIALNRIIGGGASQIHGQINANGQVVLVNPNGVFFGQSSSINVGGLIASGLDISPVDFINGNYVFDGIDGTSGAVTNAGLINASLGGSVTLLGKSVSNEGLISAKLGAVNLAAGNAAVLTFDRQGLLGIRVTEAVLQQDLGVDPALLNSGKIEAESGRVLLTASQSQDVFSAAVNHDGIEQATSVVVNDDGSFTLGGGADLVNSGNIDVSSGDANGAGQVVMLGENVDHSGGIHADALQGSGGAIELHSGNTTLLSGDSVISATSGSGEGGDIKLLGDRVGLTGASRIDASGEGGGGEVLIGGDYRGQNQRIRNAAAVFIGRDAVVDASARQNGDGGRIIAWGNDSARLFGSLVARGGGQSGKGGFVETSAAYVELDLTVDVGADSGDAGSWLIDPYNIFIGNCPVICTGAITQTTPFPDPPNPDFSTGFTSDGAGDNSVLAIATLEAAMTNGANVIVEAAGSGGLAEPNGGNITLNQALDLSGVDGTASLSLRAEHDVTISSTIDVGGAADDTVNLFLLANSDNDIDGGDVIINNAITIDEGGSFTASGDNITIASGASVTTLMDSITLTANTNGAIRLDGAVVTGGGVFTAQGAASATGVSYTSTALATPSITTSGGAVNINVDSDVDIRGIVDTRGGAGAVTVQGQNITLTNAEIATENGAVAFTGADFTSTRTNANQTIETAGGSVTMEMSGAIDIGAEIITDGGAFNVTNSAGFDNDDNNGSINTSNAGAGAAGAVSIVSSGNVVLGDFSLNGNAGGAALTVDSDMDITLARDFDFNGTIRSNLTLNAGNDVVIAATISDTSGDQSTLDVSLNADSGVMDGVGDVRINAAVYTAGGEFSASGVNFNQSGLINTDDSRSGVNSPTSADGNVILNMEGAVTLAALATESSDAACGTNCGNLTVTARGGPIIDTPGTSINVHNDTVLEAFGNDITLDAIHDFDSDGDDNGSVTILSANNVVLSDVSRIELNTSNITGNLTVDTNGGGELVQLAGSSLAVGGSATLTAAGNNIFLDRGPNDFATVSATADNVNLDDVNGIVLGTSIVATDLSVTAGGSGTITQSGALIVMNQATFTANDDNIFLFNPANDFLNVSASGDNVSIRDVNGIDLGTSSLSGNLTVIAAGDIGNSGPVVVTGSSLFFAPGSGSITLDDVANQFTGTLNFIGQGADLANVTLQNLLATNLGTLSLTDNLIVDSGGAITQSGALDVGLAAQLTAPGSDITLPNLVNDFNQLSVTGRDVTIVDLNGIVLDTSDVSGILDVTANGAGSITQVGTLLVAGNAAFTAIGNDITLIDSDNNFSSAGFDGNNVAVRDFDNIALDPSTATGNLDVTVGLNITSNGPLDVLGNATFTGTNGSSFSIDNSANQLAGGLNFAVNGGGSLANLAVVNQLAIDMPALTLSGDLSLNSATGITQQALGELIVDGDTTLVSAGNSIILNNATNNFRFVAVAAANVQLADATGINLIGANVSNDYSIVANGPIRSNNTLVVRGTTVFDAMNNNINLQNANNDFDDVNFSGSTVFVRDVNGLDFVTSFDTVTLTDQASLIGTRLEVVASGDVRFAAGGIDATGARLELTISQGDFLGLGSAGGFTNPDIVAASAEFVSLAGTFGSADRPLVFRMDPSPGTIDILSRGFFQPLCPVGNCIVNASGIDFGILASISSALGDQVVDIESLGAIDPAIFTELKNYSSEDVSILLPRDQLYEDELELEQEN